MNPACLTHFIDGADVGGSACDPFEKLNPANEKPLWFVPTAGRGLVADAVASACRAFRPWAALAPAARSTILHRCVDALRDNQESYARIVTLENGKPIVEARGEVRATIDELRSIIGLSLHIRTGKQLSEAGELSFQHARPRGVVACILPWNYPVLTVFTMVFSALAMGNTVVLKPSEKTPASALHPARAFAHSLPAGVLNVLLGDGPMTGAALVDDPRIDFVLFVGSTRAGEAIAQKCARRMCPSIMELGGKDAFIIDEGTNLDRIVPVALTCAFLNAGQICTSSERFIVHRSLYREFARRMTQSVATIKLGDGMDEMVGMGPLVDEGQRAIVAGHVEDAARRGAAVLIGGAQVPERGFYQPPAVLVDVPADARIWNEESFGPVAPIRVFDRFDEAIDIANDARYGLGAVLFTERLDHAMQATEELEIGLLKINAPIGVGAGATWEPARKSGFGFGGGRELLQSLVHQKSVVWRV